MTKNNYDTSGIQDFWEKNPLCAKDNPHAIGSPEYFKFFDRLRDDIEPPAFAETFYEFKNFAGKNVLDVGCGNGWVLSRYATGGANAYGVDLTKTGIELCEKRFAMEGLKGIFAVGNAEELPYPDSYFDCVSCVGVVHHTEHPRKAVSELHRVLKPGGRLIFMIYHRDSILYQFKFPLMKFLTGKTLQELVNEVDGYGNPRGDVYSKAELTQLLKDFQITSLFAGLLQGWMVFPKFGKYIPSSWLALLASRWGWFLYSKARRK